MSDSKAVDAQMGIEKVMSALAAGLAGARLDRYVVKSEYTGKKSVR